jgi:hypothetical protein
VTNIIAKFLVWPLGKIRVKIRRKWKNFHYRRLRFEGWRPEKKFSVENEEGKSLKKKSNLKRTHTVCGSKC